MCVGPPPCRPEDCEAAPPGRPAKVAEVVAARLSSSLLGDLGAQLAASADAEARAAACTSRRQKAEAVVGEVRAYLHVEGTGASHDCLQWAVGLCYGLLHTLAALEAAEGPPPQALAAQEYARLVSAVNSLKECAEKLRGAALLGDEPGPGRTARAGGSQPSGCLAGLAAALWRGQGR